MPAVHSITRLRRRHKDRTKKSSVNRVAQLSLAGTIVVISLFSLIILVSVTAYSYLTADLPSPLALQTLLDPQRGLFYKPTRIFDRTGGHLLATLQNPAAVERRYLSINATTDGFSEHLIDATIAATDPDFWSHNGYSFSWSLDETRSTLAQRLVSDILLWNEAAGFRRAFRERLLAAQITKIYGREKILEWFLNYAYFGGWSVGADAAALTYFGKHASQLTLSEAAVLAGLLETPSLNPEEAPLAALDTKDRILDILFEKGFVNQEEYLQAKSEKVRFRPVEPPVWRIPPTFVDLILDQISDYLPYSRLLQGGLNIISSIDYSLQSQAECATKLQLARMVGKETGSSLQKDPGCEAGRLLTSPYEKRLEQDSDVQSQVIILDPIQGHILANYSTSTQNNNPTGATGRPPGTIFTPYIYLTAFSRGMSPATMVWDIPSQSNNGFEVISNPDGQYHGPVRLRIALANDYLIPASKLLDQMGVEQVIRTAHLMGLNSFNDLTGKELPILLDQGKVSLLELNQAFAVLANQGMKTGLERKNRITPERTSLVQPLAILRVTDLNKNTLLDCTSIVSICNLASEPVISPQLAYLLTHVLSDENARWPSLGHPNPLEIGRPAAAKIGQTSSGSDTWALGYTPHRVVGIWFGAPQGDESVSPLWAAGLWHALMQFSTRDLPVQDWNIPPGISRVSVCDPSGLLPTKECSNIVTEVFISGSEPTHYDTLFRRVQINRETGRLATIFTPPEQIEERVYLAVPPEAQAWAEQAGLPTIPESIDRFSQIPEMPHSARIDFPDNFAMVGGKVPIMGRAAGPGFQFYRIQVGRGVNPQTWLQIGQDHDRAVEDGLLAVWDTAGINGLYALQLLVVGENEHIESVSIQVTIDNNPPEIKIIFPTADQVFNFPATRTITLQVDALDDFQLATVEFYLDGNLVSARKSPPFVHPWEVSLGQHKLKVKAVDLAGNSSEAEVDFTVTR